MRRRPDTREYSQKTQELEQKVLELQDGLMGERVNADQLKVISGELEKGAYHS